MKQIQPPPPRWGALSPAAIVLLTALAAAAQSNSALEPKPTLALVGGQIIDGYEGPPIRDGVILIAGERIVAVGPRSEVAVPPGTPLVSTEGMSVMPGLMDMHVHLMIVGHADYEHWDTTYMKRCATRSCRSRRSNSSWPESPLCATSARRSRTFSK